jgi:DNA-binding GntR family transcriptional regulator
MRPVFRSKNEVGYQILREAIIKGDYKPGTRLVIDELATTLGISQIPIREAMRQLEADGFVTIEPYVGATITNINASFILEVFALLESLEVIASRPACRNMTTADLKRLSSMILAMDNLVDNPEQWSQENKALHLFICECAHMELVLKMMQKVLDHWDRLRLHYLRDVSGKRIQDAQSEHKRILTAFQARDPDAVEHAIREHNHNALASYIDHLKKTGQIDLPGDQTSI